MKGYLTIGDEKSFQHGPISVGARRSPGRNPSSVPRHQRNPAISAAGQDRSGGKVFSNNEKGKVMHVVFLDGMGEDEPDPVFSDLMKEIDEANRKASRLMSSLAKGRKKGKKAHKAHLAIARVADLASKIQGISGRMPWHYSKQHLRAAMKGDGMFHCAMPSKGESDTTYPFL